MINIYFNRVSDVDPESQNLMNTDTDSVRIQVNKITKYIFFFVKLCFSFILNLWIRIRIQNPDPRTQMNPDPQH